LGKGMGKEMNYASSLRPLFLLIGILILKMLIMGFLIAFGPIHLGPDEAQYWTWSRYLDWGYYSKPPGIAWEISFGTLFFGNTELGVRFGPLIVSSALSLAVYALSLVCRISYWSSFSAALIMTFTPIGILSSLFATTDAGFVLFWVLALIPLVYAIENHKTPNYYLIGFCILLGALFKWPIYYIWFFILALMWVYPFIRTFHFVGGFLVSLLGLMPSFIWNATRGWPTFKHVWFTNISGGLHQTPKHQGLFHGNPLEFIGAQAALVSPLIFILLMISFYYLYRNFKNVPQGVRLCAIVCVTVLLGNLMMSLFQHMQGNWAVYAYPTGFVYLAWFLSRFTWGRFWLTLALMISIIMSGFVMTLPYIQKRGIFASYKIPFAVNPFKECLGWNSLDEILDNLGYNPEEDFLFADRYQDTSILSFYGPKQKRAYFLNLKGIRKNQFSFWPGMAEEQKGKRGFFITTANKGNEWEKASSYYQDTLKPYFNEIHFLGVFPLFEAYGKTVKSALIFEGLNYNGILPPETDLY
jgi:4-amino-4-deoxy-L-arabinose transferase-like glycosyltransferase